MEEARIDYYVSDSDTLYIYRGSELMATISDVDHESNDKYLIETIEDVLYGMGYLWNEDGTITKFYNEEEE